MDEAELFPPIDVGTVWTPEAQAKQQRANELALGIKKEREKELAKVLAEELAFRRLLEEVARQSRIPNAVPDRQEPRMFRSSRIKSTQIVPSAGERGAIK